VAGSSPAGGAAAQAGERNQRRGWWGACAGAGAGLIRPETVAVGVKRRRSSIAEEKGCWICARRPLWLCVCWKHECETV